MGTSVSIAICGLWLWKRIAARIRGFVRGAGLRLGLLGAAAKWLVTPAQPHQRLVPGALIRAAQGARSPTGAYAGKDCGFGWFVVSHVVLVERLVVDALW